jgi:hypothetical protein
MDKEKYLRERLNAPDQLDIPDQCSACGSARGNILGDIDGITHERYGYLCSHCYRLVRDYHKDSAKLRKVAEYIERSRHNPHATRCKTCHAFIEQSGSPRRREYCSDACKQRDYRSRHRNATVTVTQS